MYNLQLNRFRNLTIGLTLGLAMVGALLFGLAGPVSPAFAQSCTVPGTHSTIQMAIDAGAGVCDTITVSSGTFNENLTIGRNLTLNGMGQSSTTIDGSSGTRVITITGPSITVNMSNLRVTGGDASDTAQVVNIINRIGGGILVENGATLNLSNARVDNNLAFDGVTRGGYGGGIGILDGSTLYAQDVDIDNNIASSGAGTGFGGGLAVVNGSAYLTETMIISNVAKPAGIDEGRGGGLYAAGAGAGQAILQLTDSQVYSNTSLSSPTGGAGRGGGLFVGESNDTRIQLSGNTWQDNIARSSSASPGDGAGGAIAVVTLNATAQVTITNDSFSRNTANASNGTDSTDSADGGAIYIDTNSAGVGHNIVAALSSVTMTNNTAKAGSGDAVGEGGALYAAESSLAYQRGLIEGNIAAVTGSGQGGGIRLSGGPMVANRLTILDNIVRQSGGAAVFLEGGGIQASGAGSDLDLTNSILAGNDASSGQGAGLFINYAGVGQNEVARVNHVTIADDNLNSDEGIYYTGSAGDRLFITNTIVASHATGIQNSGATGTVERDYTLFYNNTNNTGGSVVGGTNDVPGDPNPLFVNPAGNDYHIQSGSPAIDAGIDAGVTDDIDGDLRPDPDSSGFDIGADEFALSKVYLPLILKNYP